jgi:hypothetical protein
MPARLHAQWQVWRTMQANRAVRLTEATTGTIGCLVGVDHSACSNTARTDQMGSSRDSHSPATADHGGLRTHHSHYGQDECVDSRSMVRAGAPIRGGHVWGVHSDHCPLWTDQCARRSRWPLCPPSRNAADVHLHRPQRLPPQRLPRAHDRPPRSRRPIVQQRESVGR